MHRPIDRGDAVQMRLGDLDRTDFLAAEGIGELCGTRAGDVVVHDAAFGSGGQAGEKVVRVTAVSVLVEDPWH